jgi:hypothetical protein
MTTAVENAPEATPLPEVRVKRPIRPDDTSQKQIIEELQDSSTCLVSKTSFLAAITATLCYVWALFGDFDGPIVQFCILI